MEIPAAEERIAVLETRLLPGRELRRDWALDFGSGVVVGVVELRRTAAGARSAGVNFLERRAVVGRRRAAPRRVRG